MEFIPARGIITPLPKHDGEGYYVGTHNMNIYRGCNHGCIYCDSRSDCYQVADFDRVRAKADALQIISEELRRKRKPGVVTTGAMSDHYNPLEKQYELTRGALQLIDQYGFGIGITTKSSLVTRDIDLLERIAAHSPTYVTFSITAHDDSLSRAIEPGASPTSERLSALREIREKGICAGVWLNPVLPFVTDTEENIVEIVRLAAASGAKYVICHFGVTMRSGNREYYYAALDRHFPGVKQQHIQTFGDSYVCTSPRIEQLWLAFREECRRHGILHEMSAVNAEIRRSAGGRQLSLFELQ